MSARVSRPAAVATRAAHGIALPARGMLGNIVAAALRVREKASQMHIALVLRSDGEVDSEERKREYRRDAVARGVPVFDELANAAKALACVRVLACFREKSRRV